MQGARGLQGVNGLQGIQGRQGIQGYTGFQGKQGIQGKQGVKGDTGLQGIQGIQGKQGEQGVQGTQGLEKEIILETTGKIANTNIFSVRYREGSKVPVDELIHQNDNVTIIFNHSFDHDAKYYATDEVLSNFSNDDQLFGAPQMMVLINSNTTTNKPIFDTEEPYVPVMYRFNYDNFYSSSPVIGIDPISSEKYAIGLQNVTEYYQDITNESGLETHHFIFENSLINDKSNRGFFTYGVENNYETFYEDTSVNTYTFSIYAMSANYANLQSWASNAFTKYNNIQCLTKIGHFDTLHGNNNGTNSTQNQIDDIQNTINDLINHLVNLSNTDNCITDPSVETYSGATPPGTGGIAIPYLSRSAYLVTRSVHIVDQGCDGRPVINQIYIDVDANQQSFEPLNGGSGINGITILTHGWNHKYDYGVRPWVLSKPDIFGSNNLSSSEKDEWKNFWKYFNK